MPHRRNPSQLAILLSGPASGSLELIGRSAGSPRDYAYASLSLESRWDFPGVLEPEAEEPLAIWILAGPLGWLHVFLFLHIPQQFWKNGEGSFSTMVASSPGASSAWFAGRSGPGRARFRARPAVRKRIDVPALSRARSGVRTLPTRKAAMACCRPQHRACRLPARAR